MKKHEDISGKILALDMAGLIGSKVPANVATSSTLSTGITELPTLTDNLDGSIDLTSCKANVYTTTDFTGVLRSYDIPALANIILTDEVINYIVVDYNSGNPIFVNTTNVEIINESDVIPVFTIFRTGTSLVYLNWDHLGIGLSNKLHQRLVKTDRFAYQSGLMLSEKNIREIAITSGRTWYGAVANTHDAYDSAIDDLLFWYPVAGVWNKTLVTQYNNTQYSDGSNLQTMLPNKYVVNWVYRTESDNKVSGYVVGEQYNKLSEAETSQIPEIPDGMKNLGILVGRIIVLTGEDTGIVQSSFDIHFAGSGIVSHSDLTNLTADDHLQYVINDGSRGQQEIKDSVKIGDIVGGNYTEIEPDGTIITRGDGKVWDDVVGSLIARRLTSTVGRLNYNYEENSITMQNNGDPADKDDRLIFNYQYPHAAVQTDATLGTQAVQRLHIHWEQVSTNRIEWQTDYRYQINGQPKNTTWTTVTANSVDDSAFSYVSGTLNQITALAEVLIPANSLSATVQYRLTRIDTTTGDIEAVFVDAHVQFDSDGSRQEYTK